jgi:xylulokinase
MRGAGAGGSGGLVGPGVPRHNGPVSLVGIDVGSSAVKAAAYRPDGSAVAHAVQAVPSEHPFPGGWEVDGDAVWDAVVHVVRRLTAEPGVERDPPKAVSVSASGRESFPARADGSALGPTLRTADDRRPRSDVAAILQRSPDSWIRDCGHVPDHMDPTNRLLWWAEQAPRTLARARWFLGWHELASLRMVGRPVVDPALASGFAVFDLQSASWSRDRIQGLGLDALLLPEVVPWATSLGPVLPRVASEMGLPGGCEFVTGSWDGSCAALGAGVVGVGSAQVSAGTWESVAAPVSAPEPAEIASNRLALTRQPSEPGWALWARSPNGTSVLDWALAMTGTGLERLEPALESTGPDPASVLIIPHLSGAPGPWPEVSGSAGAAFGLTLSTTGIDVVKAAMEGIAIDVTLAIAALRSGGSPIRTCRVTGGGARSAWWMQLKSDLLGIPVEVSDLSEPGTFGAALLAGVGSGAYGSLTEAAALARVGRRFEPDEGRAKRYEMKLADHREFANRLLNNGERR